MNRRFSVLSVVGIACAVLTFNAFAADEALTNILARKTIRVAVPQDYPPYGFVGTDMAPKGYDIEMAGI
ncbi:MAG: amino acid ABC transporter substrate-binding protein, partial [Gammaproteobacteria bacterium]|nr:amino acid ABC transporter substrate-binding protein [Gammaproteobacteria bacterium]